MKVRKNISLEEEIYLKGKTKADEMFGGNFSIYLTNLIARDCAGLKIDYEENIVEKVQSKKKHKHSNAVKESMDDILNI